MERLGNLKLFVLALVLASCGKENAADPTVAATATETPTKIAASSLPTATPTPVPSVSVDYYAKTEVRAPVNGWSTKTYTSTGYCALYGGKTYCWDDGQKTLAWSFNGTSYGPFTYSFWNVSRNAVGWSLANGGMQSDLMVVPTVIGVALNANLPAGQVAGVLAMPAVTASCVNTGGVLDCGTFVIDTNQVEL